MSVLIKGMEMPTSCWLCHFQDCGNCRLNADKVVDKCIIEDRIDDDCPLIPVPKHGDLKDADALIKAIAENMEAAKKADNYDWWNACSVAGDFVMDAPTIIPAESPKEESDV